MQHSAANDNSPRPAEFDKRLATYIPGLRKQAKHYNCDVDDLVSDTVEHALKSWHTFREDGGFWWWLKRCMQYVVARRKRIQRPRTVAIMNHDAATHPNQEEYADLSRALNSLPVGRDGEIVLRAAMGEEGPEIGARHGIGGERVRQIVRANRKSLKRMAA